MTKVKSNFLTALVCVIIALVCLFGYLPLQNVSAELFILWGWETPQTINLFTNGLAFAFLIYAVLPPIYEELIFRFALCKGLLLTKMHRVAVIIISALIFMVYHRSWSQLVYQFIMGVFLACIYLKTNRLWWTMLIHFINNAFIVTYTYLAGTGESLPVLTPGFITLALGLAAVSTVAVAFLIKKGIPHAQR